ncbi:MAG: anthranilate phosphoribosyltransferase [Verrucomicrobiota bacterium]
MLTTLTNHCRSGKELSNEACVEAVEALFDPNTLDSDRELFLLALSEKGETPAELAGFVQTLLPKASDPGIVGNFKGRPLFDCCGTGGGGLDLINVSTALMFILAALEVPVVKHGNRGVTKKSGSADVLEEWAGTLDTDPKNVIPELGRAGMAFCFAPAFHPSFKHIAPVRKALGAQGKRTIFNLLGPLLNPCRPDTQMIGVFRKEHIELFSESLSLLERQRFLILFGEDQNQRPIGEVSSFGSSILVGKLDGRQVRHELQREADATLNEFLVSSATESAKRLQSVFNGEDTSHLRDLLLLNAGVGLYVNGVAESIEQGEKQAGEVIDSGGVQRQLEHWLAS